MKLNQLKIKNFNNITSLNITDFKKINLFLGEPGQGKSTVFEVLNLLFLNLLEYKVGDYIQWNQKSFEIYGDFDFLGVNYKYTIKGTKDGYTRKLVVNNNKEKFFKNSDAVKELAKVINARLARHSCFAEQGDADKILFEKDTDRLNNFKYLFGIEKISGIVKLMADDIITNKDNIITKNSELLTLQSRTFELEEVPKLPDMNIVEYQDKLKSLDINWKIYQKELLEDQKYQEQLRQYNNTVKDLAICDDQKKSFLSELKKIKLNLKKIPEYNEYNAEKLVEITNCLNSLEKEKVLLEHERSIYNINIENIDSLKLKISGYEKELLQHKLKRVPRITYQETDLKELLDYINDTKVQINLYNNKIKSVKNGKCSECGTDFIGMTPDGFIEIKKTLEVKLNEFQKKYEEVQKQFKERDFVIRENESTEDKRDSINKNLNEINKELTSLLDKKFIWDELQYLKVLKDIKNQKDRKELCLIQKKEYEDIVTYNSNLETKIVILTDQIKDIDSKISVYNKITAPKLFKFSVVFNEIEYKDLQNKINKYNIISDEIVRINTYNDKIKKERGNIAVQISNLQTEIDELKRVNRKLDDCKKIVDKDFTAWVISKGSEFIKKKMNMFFQRAYSKYSITFEQSKRSLNFFYGNSDGIQAPVGKASGHEKVILSIAFRVAISSLQNLGLMVLDEIDLFASDKQSRRLFKILFSETNIDQYFIITHNESTKEMISNVSNTGVYELVDGTVEGYS